MELCQQSNIMAVPHRLYFLQNKAVRENGSMSEFGIFSTGEQYRQVDGAHQYTKEGNGFVFMQRSTRDEVSVLGNKKDGAKEVKVGYIRTADRDGNLVTVSKNIDADLGNGVVLRVKLDRTSSSEGNSQSRWVEFGNPNDFVTIGDEGENVTVSRHKKGSSVVYVTLSQNGDVLGGVVADDKEELTLDKVQGLYQNNVLPKLKEAENVYKKLDVDNAMSVMEHFGVADKIGQDERKKPKFVAETALKSLVANLAKKAKSV